MRILFIRHGDPDYANDTLTGKGRREAEALAERAEALDMGEGYVSPLGRAQATAAYSLEKLGKKAETLEWLQEFPAQIDLNQAENLRAAYPDAEKAEGIYKPRIIWDVIPSYWTEHSEYSDGILWRESEISRYSDAVQVYDDVTDKFDAFLPFWDYLCASLPSVESLSLYTVSHLSMVGEPPSFAARFCEVYSDMTQRH